MEPQAGNRVSNAIANACGAFAAILGFVALAGWIFERPVSCPCQPRAGLDAAAMVAGKLVEALSASYLIAPLTVEISASIGVAVYPDAGTSFETLLRRADEAMYEAKTTGKRRYALALA